MNAEDLYDLAPCALAQLTLEGVFALVNAAFLEWTGFSAADLVERRCLADLVSSEGGQFFASLAEALRRDGAVGEIFVLLRRADGACLPVYCNFSLLRDAAGAPTAISLAAFRGENRALHETELRRGKQAAEQLAAIVSNSTDAIVSVDPGGVVLTANRAFCEIFQYAPDEVIGAHLAELIVPDDLRAQFDEKLRRATHEQLRSHVVRRRRKDGHRLDLSLSTATIHDEAGQVVAISTIYRDIAPLMRAAEHIEFLLREVNHRSKNMLAVVQAVARQTARRAATPELFIDAFMARLAAIASSHDLLVSRDWRGVQIGDLTRSQFSHLDEETRGRINVAGDFLEINPRAAEAYGLALHELSTNAARYGALSEPSGAVDLRFNLDLAAKTYTLTWRESGGPVVVEPGSAGFGNSVLTRMAPLAIQGEGAVDYAPDGVIYRLSAPTAQIVMSG